MNTENTILRQIRKIAEYDKCLKRKEEIESGISETGSPDTIREEVFRYTDAIRAFYSSESSLNFYKLLAECNSRDLTYDERDISFLFRGEKMPAMAYSCLDFGSVAEKAHQMMMAVKQSPSDADAAHDFCVGLATLRDMIANRDRLAAERVENVLREYEREKNEIGDTLRRLGDVRSAEALASLKKEFLSSSERPSVEGNIVFGASLLPLSAEEQAVSERLGLPTEIPAWTALSAEENKNAVFIKTPGEKEAASFMELFLNGLYYGNINAYSPYEISFAFIEHGTLPYNPCAVFCNTLKAWRENFGKNEACKIDLCLYRSIGSVDDGLARDQKEEAALLDSLCKELLRRKALPQLKTQSVAEFNAENPHEMLPFLVLVIHDVSTLSKGLYEMRENLKNLICNGGAYGIFVLMTGSGTVIPATDSPMDLSELLPDRVFDLNDPTRAYPPLRPEEQEAIRKAWSEKCAEVSSLVFDDFIKKRVEPDLDKRKDAGLFSGEDVVAIPIGVSDGQVFFHRTSINNATQYGVSDVITGGTGSGKTCFLRMLIMSGAYFYPPDKLQFYIIDFKTSERSADFSCFSQDQNEGSAYIPHVRFLAARSGSAQAYGLLKLIEKVRVERSRLFIRYGVKDAVEYRKLLKTQMQNRAYPVYKRETGKDAMEALPQIYVVVDESNRIFNDDTRDLLLLEKLNNEASKVRSYGISLLLSGQTNTLDRSITEHFKNRIAFSATEPRNFSNTFSGRDNLEENELISGGYTFIGGRVGRALIHQDSYHCVSTAYAGSKMLSEYAKIVREKWADPFYEQRQMSPGSRETLSADVLVGFLKDPESEINDPLSDPVDQPVGVGKADNDVLPMYIGLDSLSSAPFAVPLNAPDLQLQSNSMKQIDTDPHNYFVNAAPNKQARILWNIAMYMACDLKREKIVPDGAPICVGYLPGILRDSHGRALPDREDLNRMYHQRMSEYGFGDLVRVNTSVRSIAGSIGECYRLYRSRKENQTDSFTPRLLCLYDVNSWIDALDESSEEPRDVPLEESPEFLEDVMAAAAQAGYTPEELRQYFTGTDPAFRAIKRQIIDSYLEDLRQTAGSGETKDGEDDFLPKTKEEALEMLCTLMREGCKQRIYVFFGYSSWKFDSVRFLEIEQWGNVISDSLAEPNVPYDPYLCRCRNIEVRLWEQMGANGLTDYFKKLR